MRLVLLAALAGCGRVGFDASPGDGRPPSDAIDAFDATGPRWAVPIGAGSRYLPLAGTNGEVVAAFDFQSSTQVLGQTLTGVAAQVSGAVVRLDATGALVATTVLDATTTCDLRGIAMRDDSAVLAGVSAGAQDASLGPCSTAASRQNAVVLEVDPSGTPSLVSVGASSGLNAQGWNVGVLAEGSVITSGIYSSGLSFGATSLPTASADPNAFVARLAAPQQDATWAIGLTGGVQITPGPIATEGNDLCMLGAYNGAGLDLLGATPPFLGASDELIARLDASGTPRFVRGFGSTAVESNFNAGSIVALAGGCVASITADGDVTVDATTMPASAGAAIVVWFDSTGTMTAGYRIPALAQLAVVGTRMIAAYTVTSPGTVGGTTYTPEGADVVIVELDAQGPARLLGAVGGSGDQSVLSLAAIAPDAVAIGLKSSGALQFGETSLATTDGDNVVAVLGI